MKFLGKGKYVPIFSWCDNPEQGAIDQAMNLADLPFMFKQICLMPDTHQGYGMPIGGVIACKDVIIPNAVGVDIGCGMQVVRTSLSTICQEILLKIVEGIKQIIPVGFEHHEQKQLSYLWHKCPGIPIVKQELSSAKKQLGTLGGGNHFIEIQKSDEGIHIMLHSGSRNFGFKIAQYYNKLAERLCKKWYSEYSKELAFLPISSEEGKEYIAAMNYALQFARENRNHMMGKIIEIFRKYFPDIECYQSYDVHHNYARWEHHYNTDVIIHRKGATSAKKDEIGIIPGSQGSSSYIVLGLGNEKSFTSCSHGAGRKMSRNEARAVLNLEEEKNKLENIGVIHSIKTNTDLDEASSAYKDIDIIIEEQKDLVTIVRKLSPLAVIKG